jgi:hypothetical protein
MTNWIEKNIYEDFTIMLLSFSTQVYGFTYEVLK